jgi:glyoxylase-like metal-dependent hydrolase (beta-lactamase superfamily II)
MTDLHFTGWKGKALSALIVRSFPPFTPDLVVSDRLDLGPYGVPGAEVRHIGGHTPGSLVVTVPGGVALVADLVRSRVMWRHHPQIHFVQDDVAAAHRALDELVAEGFTTFLPSHGGAFEGERLERWLAGPRVRKEARTLRRLERQSRKASR